MATTTEIETTNNVDVTTFGSNNMIEHNNEEESYYTYAYQLVSSCALPMVMKVTINMGVLQIIHDHVGPNGLSTKEIATLMKILNPNAPDILDRMLGLLATYSVVHCTTISTIDCGLERRYSPSPVTKYFVPDADNVSLSGLLNIFTNKVLLESWTKLDEAVIGGGIPFTMVHGMHIFEYASVHPSFNELFNGAMHQATTLTITKILEKYKGLENIHQLVDVGGGIGHSLRVITSKYPSIKGINFDLPHVIENALPCTGVEHISGDMFEHIPQGDAIFMKWIMHDWDDEHCLKILKNCYKALSENGKVIIVEEIIANEVESSNSSKATRQMDTLMLTQSPIGKERSKQQYVALAKGAGFSDINFDCFIYNFWVIEFYK